MQNKSSTVYVTDEHNNSTKFDSLLKVGDVVNSLLETNQSGAIPPIIKFDGIEISLNISGGDIYAIKHIEGSTSIENKLSPEKPIGSYKIKGGDFHFKATSSYALYIKRGITNTSWAQLLKMPANIPNIDSVIIDYNVNFTDETLAAKIIKYINTEKNNASIKIYSDSFLKHLLKNMETYPNIRHLELTTGLLCTPPDNGSSLSEHIKLIPLFTNPCLTIGSVGPEIDSQTSPSLPFKKNLEHAIKSMLENKQFMTLQQIHNWIRYNQNDRQLIYNFQNYLLFNTNVKAHYKRADADISRLEGHGISLNKKLIANFLFTYACVCAVLWLLEKNSPAVLIISLAATTVIYIILLRCCYKFRLFNCHNSSSISHKRGTAEYNNIKQKIIKANDILISKYLSAMINETQHQRTQPSVNHSGSLFSTGYETSANKEQQHDFKEPLLADGSAIFNYNKLNQL